MRSMITTVAALAISGIFVAGAARAEELHNGGNPVRVGNQCWVSTHPDKDTGFWKDCPATMHVSKKKK